MPPPRSSNVPGSNFKWNPQAPNEITPTGGKGQYGGAFDDYGHHFYCSNRNPLMFTVMPYEAMLRNPHAGITQVHEDIATPGAETRVYPLQITHTTADAHAGTNTACSGLGVYRGHLMPELKNNVFVPDPTGQLVTRYKIEPNGASLKATRVGDRTEFFRSSDEWSRPVNFTTGPDGAIYICDIYRRWIDHARFFPEEFVKTHDMRQGENHGRIWRVVPKGTQKLVAKTPGQYHAIPEVGWGDVPAEHADRALFLKVPAITDAGELAAILTKHADDPWMAKMVASASSKQMGRVLSQLGDSFFSTFSETAAPPSAPSPPDRSPMPRPMTSKRCSRFCKNNPANSSGGSPPCSKVSPDCPKATKTPPRRSPRSNPRSTPSSPIPNHRSISASPCCRCFPRASGPPSSR
jgi:hypothetical protein